MENSNNAGQNNSDIKEVKQPMTEQRRLELKQKYTE